MPLTVLGVGYPRTGTLSLCRALETMGLKAIHYHPERMIDVIERGDWRVYDDVDAAMDFPASLYYQRVLKEYPDAKCILTVRDPDDWIRSASRQGDAVREIVIPAHRAMVDRISIAFNGRGESPEDIKGVFLRWNAEVQADTLILPGNLLVLDFWHDPDPWMQLADFLGLPAPTSVPFPWENRS